MAQDTDVLVSKQLLTCSLDPASEFEASVQVVETASGNIHRNISHDVRVKKGNLFHLVSRHCNVFSYPFKQKKEVVSGQTTELCP